MVSLLGVGYRAPAHRRVGRPAPRPCATTQVLTARLGDIERKYGLADKAKVREEAIFDMYKEHIKSLREQVRVEGLHVWSFFGVEGGRDGLGTAWLEG